MTVDEQRPEAYETPPQAAPDAGEAERAQRRMASGMPTLFVSVFVGFVVVALVVLLLVR